MASLTDGPSFVVREPVSALLTFSMATVMFLHDRGKFRRVLNFSKLAV